MRWCVLLVAAPLCGCGTSSLELLTPGGDGGATTEAGMPNVDANVPGDGTRAAFCSGTGSPILVASSEAGAQSACIDGLAQSAFRWALCTCNGLVTAGSIVTDSFSGASGGYDAGAARNGGGLGTNGNLSSQAPMSVGGALWVSDVTGMTVQKLGVEGELHSAGRVSDGTSLTVTGDAWILGDIVSNGPVSIDGTLHQPAGETISAPSTPSIGATAYGSFTVPPACDCDPSLLVNVSAYVESYRASNDDSVVGIDPKALENVNAATTLAIPCGRIFFTRVGGTGDLHLSLSAGRTAIFIGGDLAPNGPFAIDVPPASEVDVFVEGGVVAGSSFMLGDASNPAKARLWVGSSATVNLSNASVLAGNVYAPQSELVLGSAPTTVFGSVFVNRLSAQGPLTIHYDESVLTSGSSCSAPTGTCTSCHDCANQACKDGLCGACAVSSDCCAPLVCHSGACVADIP